MDDDNQIVIPESFIALFVQSGRSKQTESYAAILRRYELCEDLACALVDQATTKKWELGVETQDIVQRIGQGLAGGAAGINDAEAGWVCKRLTELMD
jgi:hypothetical protein